MSLPIEDYALIGDTHTAALVGRDGSIDWFCAPRFDSDACFAGLLGDDSNGHWSLAPAPPGHDPERSGHDIRPAVSGTRRYRGDTLILETDFETDTGSVRLIDFMPIRHQHPRIVRIVEGLSGQVAVTMRLVVRYGYGHAVPWVTRHDHRIRLVAGPDGLVLDSPVRCRGRNMKTVADFTVGKGERVPFVLAWYPSYEQEPRRIDTDDVLAQTEQFWQEWIASAQAVHGPWEQQARRSLITLKALTYAPTGGIVAAPTTSLPEALGGVRNWDYRYCWVRDATLTLDALIEAGCSEEAQAWMMWLARAIAGSPHQLQIMYGAAGERRLEEYTLDWLAGYENSAPVRVGNAAAGQFQLDVYGELMDATDRARHHGIRTHPSVWPLQQKILDFVEAHWSDPDDGIWEVRGPRRHFVHSRVMAWVAMDRAVQAVEQYGLRGSVERWREIRKLIHDEVCEKGFNAKRGAFTQYYGSDELDASVLMIPLVGFLPPDDERVVSTVEAIAKELMVDGLVQRYQNTSGVDGLPGIEGTFLPCSFWLADCLALIGRLDEARALFDRLVGLANDVGLLSEEYDTRVNRQVGNFPQAFTHVGLINSARNLASLLDAGSGAGN